MSTRIQSSPLQIRSFLIIDTCLYFLHILEARVYQSALQVFVVYGTAFAGSFSSFCRIEVFLV